MRARLLALLLLSSVPAMTDTPKTYTGKVLPFEIVAAIRNYGIIPKVKHIDPLP